MKTPKVLNPHMDKSEPNKIRSSGGAIANSLRIALQQTACDAPNQRHMTYFLSHRTALHTQLIVSRCSPIATVPRPCFRAYTFVPVFKPLILATYGAEDKE